MPRPPPPLALLVLLVLSGAPSGGAQEDETKVTCDYVEAADYFVGTTRIHYGSHRCRWYDIWIKATIVQEVERYDAYRKSLLADYEAQVLTLYTFETETQYRDGRVNVHHVTWVQSGPTLARVDYREDRDAQGNQACRGALDFHTGYEILHVSVPTTPRYPTCVPPGRLP